MSSGIHTQLSSSVLLPIEDESFLIKQKTYFKFLSIFEKIQFKFISDYINKFKKLCQKDQFLAYKDICNIKYICMLTAVLALKCLDNIETFKNIIGRKKYIKKRIPNNIAIINCDNSNCPVNNLKYIIGKLKYKLNLILIDDMDRKYDDILIIKKDTLLVKNK